MRCQNLLTSFQSIPFFLVVVNPVIQNASPRYWDAQIGVETTAGQPKSQLLPCRKIGRHTVNHIRW